MEESLNCMIGSKVMAIYSGGSHISVFNRPGVPGTVLQTPSHSLIHSFINSLSWGSFSLQTLKTSLHPNCKT